MTKKINLTKEQWKERLSPQQYHICFEKGTEAPFSGSLNDYKEDAIFVCTCCGEDLFDSIAKYDSGSGWPSFYEPIKSENITEIKDQSLAMERVEVTCSSCGSHLGHVFPDGPNPTGMRYCINSLSLKVKAKDNK